MSAQRRCLAAIAAVALFPMGANPASAFKLFGKTFFEKNREVAVVPDAQPYELTFEVPGADKDLKRAIEQASALSRDFTPVTLPNATAEQKARVAKWEGG